MRVSRGRQRPSEYYIVARHHHHRHNCQLGRSVKKATCSQITWRGGGTAAEFLDRHGGVKNAVYGTKFVHGETENLGVRAK